ncbi:MAG: prolyl oligopeptidase family serine peptidase [Bradymonadaceae bacterium]
MEIPFEAYLNIRSARNASPASDADRVAFLTDIGGTPQAWCLDEPLAWPNQLTFFEDRLLFVDLHPEGHRLAFGKDQGGDERQRIYTVPTDGGTPSQLSPTDAKHMWGGWSPDGERVAWSHNGRNGRDFDVYLADAGTGEEERVHRAEGFVFVADWMPGGERLLVNELHSNVDSDLYLLDLDSGERRHLTPHDDDALYRDPTPTPDGRSIYLHTDEDRDFSTLARYDVDDDELTLVGDRDWDRESLDVSDDGQWLASTLNVDGYSELELRNLRSGEVRTSDTFETSIVSGLEFAPKSATLAATVTGPDDTTDVWTVDVESDDARRWTRSSTGGVPRDTFVAPRLVRFESFDGLEVPAFYSTPPDAEPPYPVLVDVHGGPEAQRRPRLSPTTQYFVHRGFAVFEPNVRGSRGYGKAYMALDDVRNRMDSVADLNAGWEWLVESGGADPDSIAVYGASYGGFMVLSSLVTYPQLWAAGVDMVGVANFVTFLENTSDYRRHLREAEYGSLDEDREFLESISPLNHLDALDAPLMVVHGANDPRVPVSEAEAVAEAAEEKGLPVECLIYEDEGHGLAKRENRLDAYPQIADFLEEQLLDGIE